MELRGVRFPICQSATNVCASFGADRTSMNVVTLSGNNSRASSVISVWSEG